MADTAVAFKAKGNEFFKKGDFGTAIIWYTKAVDADPNNRVYYSNRAAAYQKLGRFDKAATDGRLCIKCDRSWNKGYFRLATALQSLGKYEELMQVCKTGLEKTSDPNLLKIKEANAERAKQQEAKRLSSLPKAERLKGEGDRAVKNSETDKAEKLYTQAIDACSDEDRKGGSELYLKCLSNRAYVRQQLGNHPGVVEDCVMMLEHRDNLSENLLMKALYRRGSAFQATEKFRFGLSDATELCDLFTRKRMIADACGNPMKPVEKNSFEDKANTLKQQLSANVRQSKAARK